MWPSLYERWEKTKGFLETITHHYDHSTPIPQQGDEKTLEEVKQISTLTIFKFKKNSPNPAGPEAGDQKPRLPQKGESSDVPSKMFESESGRSGVESK